MKVINLLGGPGIGKSVLRAEVFAALKKLHLKVDEAPEYAKDMVHEDRSNILSDQLYMLAKQNRRLARLVDTYDYAVTDSPILLSLYYGKNESEAFKKLVIEKHSQYDNINILLERTVPYQTEGRYQNEEEAKLVDIELKQLLVANGISFITVNVDENAVDAIVKLATNPIEREYKLLFKSSVYLFDFLEYDYLGSTLIHQWYTPEGRYRATHYHLPSDSNQNAKFYHTVKTKLETSDGAVSNIEVDTCLTEEEFPFDKLKSYPKVLKTRHSYNYGYYRLEFDYFHKQPQDSSYYILEVETPNVITDFNSALGFPTNIKLVNVSDNPAFSNFNIALNNGEFPIELAKELLEGESR